MLTKFYCHSDLVKAVPEEHKKFLRELVWIHEEVCYPFMVQSIMRGAKGVCFLDICMVVWQENVPIDTNEGQIICKLIAVHAGLERSIDLNEQFRILRTKDTKISKVAMLSGRQDVWNIPKVSKYFIPLQIAHSWYHNIKVMLLLGFRIS